MIRRDEIKMSNEGNPVTNEETKEPVRKLASIQVISSLKPIEGADRIVCATILGWECVVKKDEGHKVGDLIIFIEPDSILPEKPEFEFLRERKFRVKTIKLRKQISQGLVMPLSILPSDHRINLEEGVDVTEILQIRKHDSQLKEENDLVQSQKNRSPILRFFMNFSIFRYIYFKLFGKIKGNWPDEYVQKTDETRIQVCARKLMEHYNEEWYIGEKLDGQSFTAFTYLQKAWGLWRKSFGICSRNLWLKSRGKNNYWKMAEKYALEQRLIDCKGNIVIQGEICGPGIQGNKYNLAERKLYVFNVFRDGIMFSLADMESFCNCSGLQTVPILNRSFIPSRDIGEGKEVSEVVKHMVELSQGDSQLLKRKREGIVVRLKSNPRISFKVINPYFLLEEDKND